MHRYLFVIANKLPSSSGEDSKPYDSFGALRCVGETLSKAGYPGSLTAYPTASVYDFSGSTWEFSSLRNIDSGTRRRLEGYPGVTIKDL